MLQGWIRPRTLDPERLLPYAFGSNQAIGSGLFAVFAIAFSLSSYPFTF
jgi:hypothetical protein